MSVYRTIGPLVYIYYVKVSFGLDLYLESRPLILISVIIPSSRINLVCLNPRASG